MSSRPKTLFKESMKQKVVSSEKLTRPITLSQPD
jgi:hypothetical protein